MVSMSVQGASTFLNHRIRHKQQQPAVSGGLEKGNVISRWLQFRIMHQKTDYF